MTPRRTAMNLRSTWSAIPAWPGFVVATDVFVAKRRRYGHEADHRGFRTG